MCTKLYGILCERREVIKKKKKVQERKSFVEKKGDRN